MTLADFYTQVLRELGVVPPNGTAEPEDRQRVVEKYPLVHAALLSEGLVTWSVTESIPNKVVLPLTKLVACALKDEFSVSAERYLVLKQEGELFASPPSLAERQLRKLQAGEYVPSTLATEYF